ncbi:MAG: glutamyl-tRNA reductase [Lachnospiraceae bacterium]|nr:glutamyl-tRNA reductase [Lachnospiraceae bacterium]
MMQIQKEIPLFSLSISHKQAPVEVRKLFSFSQEERQLFLRHMKETDGVWGVVLVSTCNRTEVYFSGERKAVQKAEKLLAGEKKVDIHLLRKYYRSYQGEKVAQHLFHVMSGLDSMVLGEDEILGQMREAYNAACRENCTDYYINAVFQRALSCAKQVKTKTCLSKSSVSIATLSAAETVRFKEKNKNVLLLGITGQMGGLIAKNLAGRKDIRLYATVRRHSASQFPEGVKQIAYEERYDYIDDADVIISATASPHYTITYEACKKAVKTGKDRLFLDIAVPNDIDPDVSLLDGSILRNIDYFKTIASDHNSQKEEGREQAESIIQSECEEAEKELLFHEFWKDFEELKKKLQGKSAEQLLYILRDNADAEELKAVIAACRKILADKE